jgi:hypothetical protein
VNELVIEPLIGGRDPLHVDRGKVATWRLGRNTGRINDETMNQLVPPSLQHTCSGPRGTVVFTDTCSVFHRGSIAHSEDGVRCSSATIPPPRAAP